MSSCSYRVTAGACGVPLSLFVQQVRAVREEDGWGNGYAKREDKVKGANTPRVYSKMAVQRRDET